MNRPSSHHTSISTPPSRSLLRMVLGTAATWGFACWLAALPWTLGALEFGLPPLLLALVAGALCAFSFTNWALSLSSRRIGWGLRMGMLLTVVVMFVNLTPLFNVIKPLPDWASRQLLFLMIAFCLLGTWVLKMELCLFIDWLSSGVGKLLCRFNLLPKEEADLATATWMTGKARSAVLEIQALRWSIRALIVSIVAITLFGGGLSLVILISLDLYVLRLPPALTVSVCAVIGSAAAYLFLAYLRARRRTWKIMIDAVGISAACVDQAWVFPWGS